MRVRYENRRTLVLLSGPVRLRLSRLDQRRHALFSAVNYLSINAGYR